jgi:hypothetical protein
MNKMLIPALAASVFLPLMAHAQAYKCQQADGSLGFQDLPCQKGTAGSRIDLAPVQGYSDGLDQTPGEIPSDQRMLESTGHSNGIGSANAEQGVNALYIDRRAREERLREERLRAENLDRQRNFEVPRPDTEARPVSTRVQASNSQIHPHPAVKSQKP